MHFSGGRADEALTQFAVLDALLAGVYESGITVGELRRHGDFGLGCCDGLGGEVIVLDGEAFECTLDGPPALMQDAEVLPFAEVCRFLPGAPTDVEDADLAAATALVERALSSRNLFHAVRVDGEFASMRVRATARQQHPYRPLPDVTREQVETELGVVRGTLVGFWVPAIYQGIAVAGLHIHFLADDRRAGGHVLDMTVRRATLRLAPYARFDLRLPTDDLFLRRELTHADDHRIVAIEGGA